MKKIWSKYSYAIFLICLSCVLTLVVAQSSQTTINDDYLSITVQEGDSLWLLAETYADAHELSSKQFINWVKKTNKIGEDIYVGESIVIPVKKEDLLVASSRDMNE